MKPGTYVETEALPGVTENLRRPEEWRKTHRRILVYRSWRRNQKNPFNAAGSPKLLQIESSVQQKLIMRALKVSPMCKCFNPTVTFN